MRTIKVWDKIISLEIGDEITVKELRKIQPILSWRQTWQEIEFAISIIKVLSTNPEENEKIIDTMTYAEFLELSEKITGLLDFEKKTK